VVDRRVEEDMRLDIFEIIINTNELAMESVTFNFKILSNECYKHQGSVVMVGGILQHIFYNWFCDRQILKIVGSQI
jgi:hypothetical protein